MAETKQPNRQERPRLRICSVCTAPSRCSYFGAVCCESCKVFFRRAVVGKTKYSCLRENDCEITMKTRRTCSSCRYEKCLRVGMLEKWVINSPRAGLMKRKISNSDHNDITSEYSGPMNTKSNPVNLEACNANCQILFTKDDDVLVDDLLRITRETIQEIPFPDEVFVERPTFTHIINVLSIVVRRMIAFTKTFPAFRLLGVADQVVILKSVSLEIMLTRKATTLLYKVTEKHGLVWMVEKGRFLFSKTNLAHAYDESLYERYMAYITTLMNLQVDDKALVILTCVCLFSPDREDLSQHSKTVLETEQLRYVSLLERYLHFKYGCAKARKTFPKMLVAQCWAREASYYYNKAAMKCSTSDIEPLMKEFFDME